MSYDTQEDPTLLWNERATFVSSHLSAVGYGIHVAVFFTVTYYTLTKRNQHRLFWLIFNTSLFVIGTINVACSILFNENAWVTKRGYPGGPAAYLWEQQWIPTQTLGNTASILASFLADGLMLQRVIILYNWNWWVIVPPALFYIACVILSILTTVQIALPTQTSWQPLSLPVWIVLMILPMWLTALIIGRIWYNRRQLVKVMGLEAAKMYSGVSAIVIESALPFTIISIILLGLFGDNNIAQNLFVSLMVQIECIAPEMIVLRVILGHAWTSNTMKQGGKNNTTLSTMQFAGEPEMSATTASTQILSTSDRSEGEKKGGGVDCSSDSIV